MLLYYVAWHRIEMPRRPCKVLLGCVHFGCKYEDIVFDYVCFVCLMLYNYYIFFVRTTSL